MAENPREERTRADWERQLRERGLEAARRALAEARQQAVAALEEEPSDGEALSWYDGGRETADTEPLP